jgi:hypothetical protein
VDWVLVLVTAALSGLASGGVCWGVLKTELKYLRRDVDRNTQAIADAHRRIDSLRSA